VRYLVEYLEEEEGSEERWDLLSPEELQSFVEDYIDHDRLYFLGLWSFDETRPSFLHKQDIDDWIEEEVLSRAAERKHMEQVSSPYWSGRV
jgi:hypothetical protein